MLAPAMWAEVVVSMKPAETTVLRGSPLSGRLRHEDQGMLGRFVVVEPCGEAGTVEHEHD